MAKPEERHGARTVMVGFVVLAVVIVAVLITTNAQKGRFLPPRTVKMAFDNVHTLAVNDDIRIFGNRVGRISSVEFENGKAVVTGELITSDPTIYRNATARVLSVSPLALKYVNLEPGTPEAGLLPEGAIVPSEQNVNSADYQDLLQELDPATRSQATSTVRELGTGLGGHGPDLNTFLGSAPKMLGDLQTTSAALSSPEFDMTGTLRNVRSLTDNLQSQTERIRSLMPQADATLRAVRVDDGKPLQETFRRAPETLSNVRKALSTLKDPLADVQQTMVTIQDGAGDLGDSVPDTRAFLRDATSPLGKVPGVSDKAEPAVDDLGEAVNDARPLAPKVATAFNRLNEPLGVLAPYGKDIGSLFRRSHSFVSEGGSDGTRYVRLSLDLGAEQATSALYPSNGAENDYPKPGQSSKDRYRGLVPPGVIPTGPEPTMGGGR